MKTTTDDGKIDELLNRGVDKIYPSKDALKEGLLIGNGKTLGMRLYS